uniref:DUF5362 domain-containing protein n=1 Tax=candidate division WOR-3 bacterium TaxID=2052148 RepID=A0A7C4GCT9_UNCW3
MEQPVAVQTTLPESRTNARAMSGWLKFIGIVSLVSGILQALSIVGIVWAWLTIWVGILLNQAGSRARAYADNGDEAALNALTAKLKTTFAIIGILTIISIGIGLIAGIVWVIIIATGGMGIMSTLLEQLKGLNF